LTNSLKNDLTPDTSWPQHKKVIIIGDRNQFMGDAHFAQGRSELHLTLKRDQVIIFASSKKGGRAVPGNLQEMGV
jgi:hypothetical protein